jgi:hypothetical protein
MLVRDEFDLDARFFAGTGGVIPMGAPGRGVPGWYRAEGNDTVAPQQTCPADTCSLGCETMTCPEATCGCDTSETCINPMCGSDAITFGNYCEDQSDETCHQCPDPGTGGCADPPDVDP